jgi:hypothetical protein
MLDMLAGETILLVRWPKGCCSRSQRWHMGRQMGHQMGSQMRRQAGRGPALAPVYPKADGNHVFFLSPQS